MTPNAHHQVAVAGASGRMGHMLIEAIARQRDCVLAGALDIASSPAIGQDASGFYGPRQWRGHHGRPGAGLKNAQVLIDFTRPEGTLAHLAGVPRAGRESGHRHHRLHRGAKGRDRRCRPATSPSSWRPT
jgi:4-hydroxy-tetrahydrodipicolinate reductase